MSRFDIILILRDPNDKEWDQQASDHVIDRFIDGITGSDEIWSLDRLQSHFLAIRNVQPIMSPRAENVLAKYYSWCRADPKRDPARTTRRMFDSLIRLAQSHARLVFRTTVNLIDTIIVIMLVESSWGFGRLIPPPDVVKTQLPIGPTIENILQILDLLNVDYDPDTIEEELKVIPKELVIPTANSTSPVDARSVGVLSLSPTCDDVNDCIESTVPTDLDCSYISLMNRQNRWDHTVSSATRSGESLPARTTHQSQPTTHLRNMLFDDTLETTDDNLDAILSFDSDVPIRPAPGPMFLNQIFTQTQEDVESIDIPPAAQPRHDVFTPKIPTVFHFKRKTSVENDQNLNNLGKVFGFQERTKIQKVNVTAKPVLVPEVS